VENFLATMPSDVRLQVFTRPAVVTAAHARGASGWSGRVWIRTLRVMQLSAHTYNVLFTTASFWREVYGKKVLVFQTDTVLCPNTAYPLSRFLGFDYIGAAWEDCLPNEAAEKCCNPRAPCAETATKSLGCCVSSRDRNARSAAAQGCAVRCGPRWAGGNGGLSLRSVHAQLSVMLHYDVCWSAGRTPTH